MPDAPGRGPANASARVRWRVLGRLLPRPVRERIFEPAFDDLLRESLESSRSGTPNPPFGLRVVGTFLGCVPPAVVRVFVVEGRLTRFSRITGVVVILSAILSIATRWIDYGYG